MRIDLHIHSSEGSDGLFTLRQILAEARSRGIDFLSITDHDSLDCQHKAIALAAEYGIAYVTGVELNVTFRCPETDGDVSLDFLGYSYDVDNGELRAKLRLMKERREIRAHEILQRLNVEFAREGQPEFTSEDLSRIQERVDGAFGRPHIADYLVEKGIVTSRREAFERYLVKCDVPKYPLSLEEASGLVRHAGGLLVHAHPGDPNGTSLATITPEAREQTAIIERYMLEYIDGIECWHSRHGPDATAHYMSFAATHGLIMTGGSDCHQKPLLLGTVDVPDWVASQFTSRTTGFYPLDS